MGFGNLSQPLTEAIEKTKSARLQTELNKKAQEETSTTDYRWRYQYLSPAD